MTKKKILCAIVALMLLMNSVGAVGAFYDVPQNAPYAEALERIAALGIVSGMGDGSFQPNETITREQFATLIVKVAGLEDLAESLAGSSIFPDIDPHGWSAGYINAALSKGFISGKANGKFDPEDKITFAEACTVLVRALGYTDSEVTGLWPRNFIEKARSLGLTPNMNFASNDALERWAAVVMIDRLLVTDIKSTSGTTKTFADASALYTDCIVLATPEVSTKLTEGQVLTDKGTYYIGNPSLKLEVGSRYKVVLDDETIENAYKVVRPLIKISVDSIVDTKITYKTTDGVSASMTLPEKTVYYYQGVVQKYDNLKSILTGRTSIVLAYNEQKTGFDYGIIVDPVYSIPHIVSGNGAGARISGNLNLTGASIIKDGELITNNDLEDMDVVYQVSDIWDANKFYLVVKNRVSGEITNILPNKFAPKTIQIEGKDYELGKDFNISKLNSTPGSFAVENEVTILLGSDGRVVDVVNRDTQDNSSFAFVINTGYKVSETVGEYAKVIYNVKLLLTDGTTAIYDVDKNVNTLKGKLVTYQRLDEDRVYVEEIDEEDYLNKFEMKERMVSTDQRLLDEDYVAENVKIFDVISNETGTDADVQLVDWNDIPRGVIQASKVQYINKSGPFADINVLVTNDLFDKKTRLGIVSKVTSSGNNSASYTLLIDDKQYTYSLSTVPGATVGSVFKVKLVNGKVEALIENRDPESVARKVQAIDSKRVKINDKVYWFRNGAVIYKKDATTDALVRIGTEDVDLTSNYMKAAVYSDKTEYYGGKIEVLVLTE